MRTFITRHRQFRVNNHIQTRVGNKKPTQKNPKNHLKKPLTMGFWDFLKDFL
jgi:hypothetical protein